MVVLHYMEFMYLLEEKTGGIRHFIPSEFVKILVIGTGRPFQRLQFILYNTRIYFRR